MSCFQLPDGICEKMRAIVSNHWWGFEGGKRKCIGNLRIGWQLQNSWEEWVLEIWKFSIKQCLEDNVGGWWQNLILCVQRFLKGGTIQNAPSQIKFPQGRVLLRGEAWWLARVFWNEASFGEWAMEKKSELWRINESLICLVFQFILWCRCVMTLSWML
jgi:hypothetical protein